MQTIASLSLTPGPDTVTQAQAWLENLATAQQWAARTSFGLLLSLDEALSNVLMYGFPPGSTQQTAIHLTAQSDNGTIILDIVDNGIPFDPTRHCPSALPLTLDDAIPGGHGLRLMRNYLDDIQYHYADGQNHLRLITKPASTPTGDST